jgi:hypothetical protein
MNDLTIAHAAAEYTALALMALGTDPGSVSEAFILTGLAIMASERPETALALIEAYSEALDG